jgi:hypothetical protein
VLTCFLSRDVLPAVERLKPRPEFVIEFGCPLLARPPPFQNIKKGIKDAIIDVREVDYADDSIAG